MGDVIEILRTDRYDFKPPGPYFETLGESVHERDILGTKFSEFTQDYRCAVIYRWRGEWVRRVFLLRAGLRHDGSSIPTALHGFVDHRRVRMAGRLHDPLYQTAILPRAEADHVWRVVARHGEYGANGAQAALGRLGLWVGGRWAWRRHERRRLAEMESAP